MKFIKETSSHIYSLFGIHGDIPIHFADVRQLYLARDRSTRAPAARHDLNGRPPLLLGQDELPGFHKVACLHPAEVHPAGEIRSVEAHLMVSCILIAMDEAGDLLTQGIVDREYHIRPRWEAIPDHRRWIERIGKIGAQLVCGWHIPLPAGNKGQPRTNQWK